jgi:3'(2'), 5'-bisphosphate nucleotidase
MRRHIRADARRFGLDVPGGPPDPGPVGCARPAGAVYAPGMSDHDDAHRIATEAGALLLEIRADAAAGRLDPSQLKDDGDRRSNDLILRLLAESHPDDAVLSEERADDPSRVHSERTWIVDPLDGTREFGEDPRSDWAVHVALVEKGFPTAAAVALPAQGRTLSTVDPPALPPRVDRPPVLVVSRTRPPAETEIVRAALGGDLLPMGSAGAKAMAVVLGEADVYVHGGGQWEWDSAAPVGVAAAVGLHVSRLDGSPLVYNQVPPWLPDLVICRPELAEQVLAAAASAAPH